MSKHWNPPPQGEAAPFEPRRQWTRAQAYWRDTAHHRRMPPGAKPALVFLALACAGIAAALFQVIGTHAEFTSNPSLDWNAIDAPAGVAGHPHAPR